jgi:uncharacterized protein
MKKLSVFFYRTLRISYQYPVRVILFFLLVLLVSFFFSARVKTVYDIQDTIGKDFATFHSLDTLRSDFHRKHNLTLLLSRSDNAELNATEHCRIRAYFENLGLNHKDLKKIESVYDVRSIAFTETGYIYPELLGLDCQASPPVMNSNWRQHIRNSPWKSILSGNRTNDVVIDMFFADEATPKEFDGLLKQIQSEFGSKDYQVTYTGTGAFQVYVSEGYQQSQWLNLLIAFILLITFKLFFGGFKSGIILIFSLIYTTIVVTGVLGALNYPIDFLTQSIFTIMTIATLEDYIFVVFLRQRKGLHWKTTYRKIIVPSFFTSLTTFIGFISLVTSDLEIIKRFGIVTAIGCMIEWAVVFILLPALEQKFPKIRLTSKKSEIDFATRFLNKLESWTPNRIITVVLSVFFLTWVPGAQNLVTNDSPTKVFHSQHPFMTSLNKIKSDRGWEAQVSVLFENYTDIEDHPEIIQKIKNIPMVIAVENPLDVTKYYLDKAPANLHNLIKDELKDSYYFKKFLSQNSRGQLVLYVSESEIVSIRKLQSEVNKICNGHCELANGLVSYTEFGDRVPRTLYESMISGLLLIAFVLFILSRLTKTKGIISILLSSFWGPCFVITILWLTNVNINYTTCIFASICLGLAGDNAIQYMFSSRKGSLAQKVEQLSQPTIIMSFLLMAIPLTMVLSYFVNMIDLGILFCFGMMANLFGDLYLLKAYLGFFSKVKK